MSRRTFLHALKNVTRHTFHRICDCAQISFVRACVHARMCAYVCLIMCVCFVHVCMRICVSLCMCAINSVHVCVINSSIHTHINNSKKTVHALDKCSEADGQAGWMFPCTTLGLGFHMECSKTAKKVHLQNLRHTSIPLSGLCSDGTIPPPKTDDTPAWHGVAKTSKAGVWEKRSISNQYQKTFKSRPSIH